LPTGISLEQVDVWFQDEARFGQRGTTTRVWAEKDTRPRVIRQQQYEYSYVFGAVCPNNSSSAAIVVPAVNNEAMKCHLLEIEKQVPEGRHAVVILDRAAWHTSQKVNCFKNLTLLPLPAASPELNPQEQVWQWMRDKKLANRNYKNYEDIVDSCCDAWNAFIKDPKRIKSVCSRDWANV